VSTPTPADEGHVYRVGCAWEGSTGGGYDAYERGHRATTDPPTIELSLSSDPAFGGDPALLDPEQLFVLAASSCQLLSFLAVAARARLDVLRYEDRAVGHMPADSRPLRISRIALHPRVSLRGPVDTERVLHLVEVAHRECFIANSVSATISVEPTIEIV
jgi:organic hydroperoxide reductase OsmC/OhrA